MNIDSKNLTIPINRIANIENLSNKNYFFTSSKKKVVQSISQLKNKIEDNWKQTKADAKQSDEEKKQTLDKLENYALRLANSSKNFKKHCWFGSSLADRTSKEISLWAFQLITEKKLTVQQHKRTHQYQIPINKQISQLKEIIFRHTHLKNPLISELIKCKKELVKLKSFNFEDFPEIKQLYLREKKILQSKIHKLLLKRKNQILKKIRNIIPDNKKLQKLSLIELLNLDKKIKKLIHFTFEDELKQIWWDQNCRLQKKIQDKRIDCGEKDQPVETESLNNAREATSIFTLVNLGPLHPSLTYDQHCGEQIILNDHFTLSFAIKSMEQMLIKNEVPENQKNSFLELLNSYKAGYRFHKFSSTVFPTDQQNNTTENIENSKKQIRHKLLEELEKVNEISIFTGYNAKPSGHSISLSLFLRTDESGCRFIRGEITNRGEGVDIHGTSLAQGTKRRVNPYLKLPEIPLEEFKEGLFLQILPELSLLNVPTTHLPAATDYTIRDFYHVLLPLWSNQKLIEQDKEKEVRGLQHGDNCTFKAVITAFRGRLSSQFARFCKLKMRVESLELYFLNGKLSKASIPFLEWTLKKIHQTIKKIEFQDDFIIEHPILSNELIRQKKYYRLLSEKVLEKIELLNKEKKSFDFFNIDILDTNTTPKVEYIRSTDLIKPKKEKQKPFEIGLISVQKFIDLFKQIENNLLNHQACKEVLNSFPLCTDNFWTDSKISKILPIITKTIDTYYPAFPMHFNSYGVRGFATKLNIFVGILISIKNLNIFANDYIKEKAAQMLGILIKNGSQLRTGHIDSDEKIRCSIQKLNELSDGTSIEPKIIKENDQYYVIIRPCGTKEEILKDPTSYDRYERALKLKKDASIEEVMDTYPMPIGREPAIQSILLSIEEHLLLDVGLYGGDRSRNGHFVHRIGREEFTNKIKRRLVSLDKQFRFNREDSFFYGSTVRRIFNWCNHLIVPSQRAVEELLDPRLKWNNEERTTQNEQIKASRNNHLTFTNKKLHTQEVERLLSVLIHSESLIPQLIHCFSVENSFSQLVDPTFKALFHGLLLSKNSTGEKTLVEQSLEKGGTILAASLVDFIKLGMIKSDECGWLETELFFIFILAQIIGHFPSSIEEDFKERTISSLINTIQRLEKRKLSEKDRNICNHWLVAMYAFDDSLDSQDFEDLCVKAYLNLAKNYRDYHFKDLTLVNECFEMANKSLEKITSTIIENKLPDWVILHSDFTSLNIKEYYATYLEEGKFQISTKDGLIFLLDFAQPILNIYKKFENGKFYLFSSSKEVLKNTCEFLLNETVCWTSEEETLIVSKKDNQLLARYKDGRILHPTQDDLGLISEQIQKVDSNKNKTDNLNYTCSIPLVNRLLKLHHEILVWKELNTGKITEITFPSLKLTLKHSINVEGNSTWISPQYNNMEVDFQSCINDLYPYDHYLILKSAKKKIALVVKRQITTNPVNPTLFENPPNSIPSTVIYTFQLHKDRIILPLNGEELLYLLHLALRSHQYKRALQLTKQLKMITQWNDESLKMIKEDWLDQTISDTSLYASALRIKIRELARKAQPKIVSINYNAFEKDYFNSLDDFILGKKWWISLREEDIISVACNNTNTRIRARKRQLNTLIYKKNSPIQPIELATEALTNEIQKDSAKDKESNQEKLVSPRLTEDNLSTLFKDPWCDDKRLERMCMCLNNPAPIAIFLRPGDAFVNNFLYYYQIAYHLAPEVELLKLMNLLRTSRFGSVPEIEILRRILHATTIRAQKKLNFPEIYTPDQMNDAAKQPKLFHNNVVNLYNLYFHNKEKNDSIHNFRVQLENEWSLLPYLKKYDVTEFKPKTAVIQFNHTAPLKVTEEVSVSIEPTTCFKDLFLKIGFILPQNQEIRGLNIQKDIDALNQLKAVYQSSDYQKNQVLEGLEAKIKELTEAKNEPHYLIPTVVDPDMSHKWFETQQWLQNAVVNSNTKIHKLKNEIKALANQRKKTFGSVLGEIGGEENLKLNELLIYFAQKKENKILEANSELQGEKIRNLKKLVIEYLIELTDRQQWERALLEMDKVNKTYETEKTWGSVPMQHVIASFVSTLIQERSYDPVEDIQLLVFEGLSEIRLHKEQFNALKKLKAGSNFELEARTGFGKTKVLVPLWLLLNCQPGHITTFTTTASLLNDQVTHLKKIFANSFKTAFEVIEFSKEKADDSEYLRWLERRLYESEENGDKVFLLKIDALHGISGLALKDQMFRVPKDSPQISETMCRLDSIRCFFLKGRHFVDESGECLSIRHTYDYASGLPKLVMSSDCKRAGKFFEKVILNSKILSKWSLEFLSDFQYQAIIKNKPIPTETPTDLNYNVDFLPDLIEASMDFLNIPSNKRQMVSTYLAGKDIDGGKLYYSSLSQSEKENYAYCFHQIHEHLKISLLKKCGERYDVSKTGLAIPLDNGSPKPKNEFATIIDLFNFTLQANLKNPIDKEKVREFIKQVQNHIFKYGFEAETEHPGVQLFSKLKKKVTLPKKVFSLKEKHFDAIVKVINDPINFKLRIAFISLYILPQIKTLPIKISGNLYTLIDSLGTIHAASGTVTPHVLPPSMKPIDNKSALIANLLPVWRNSSHKIQIIKSKDGAQILKKLLQKRPDHRVLIDAGGLLRDLSQQEIVKGLLEISKDWMPAVSGVTFYDNDRNCMVWKRNADSPIPVEQSDLTALELITFIRQSHSVGSDIEMAQDAKGICTVSRTTTEKFFLQAIGRMRGLNKGQTITFAITEQDAVAVKMQFKLKTNKITLPNLLLHVQKREIEQNRKDYYFALKLFLKSSLEKQMWGRYLDNSENFFFWKIFECYRFLKDVLVESTETDLATGLFSKVDEVEAATAVELIKDGFVNKVKVILAASGNKQDCPLKIGINLQDLEKTFKKFLNFDYLEKTILVGEKNNDAMTCEVEADKTQESQKETETQNEKELAISAARNFTPAKPIDWDGNYQKQFIPSQKRESILGIPIFESPNLPLVEADKETNPKVIKPAYQYILRINKNKNEVALLALDLNDMKEALGFMQNRILADENYFYHMISNNDVIASEGSKNPIKLIDCLPEPLTSKIGVITRILSGGDSFSRTERNWVKKEFKNESIENRQAFVKLLDKTTGAWPKQESMRMLVV